MKGVTQMYVVIKRDGRQVQFDASKIEIAILKAMRYGSGIVNEELAKKIAEDFSSDKMIVSIKEIDLSEIPSLSASSF